MQEKWFHRAESDCCRKQAIHMADSAGIILEEDQITVYRESQEFAYTEESFKALGRIPCDQEILDSVLNPEQRLKFRKAFSPVFRRLYPEMFPPEESPSAQLTT
jgi:hypothetical protein